jgi:hypothetical protein
LALPEVAGPGFLQPISAIAIHLHPVDLPAVNHPRHLTRAILRIWSKNQTPSDPRMQFVVDDNGDSHSAVSVGEAGRK